MALPPMRAFSSQSPSSLDRAQEGVVDAHGIVGVLAGNRAVGLALPIGVEARKLDGLEALPRELDDALDVVVRHEGRAGGPDLALERRIFRRIEAMLAVPLAIHAGLHHGGQMLWQALEPATSAATFCSSSTFQLTNSSMSG